MVMLEAKVHWVIYHDFEHEEFCGHRGVGCDVLTSAVLGVYGLHLNIFHYNFWEISRG